MKRGNLDTETQTQGEYRVKMIYLQAKEDQRLPAKHQKLGMRHRTDSHSQPTEGTSPANTLILNSQPPEP